MSNAFFCVKMHKRRAANLTFAIEVYFLTNVQYEELSTSDKDIFSAKKELTFAVTGSKLWA